MFFMIPYEQSYVLNELIRVNDSLWDKIENSNELDEVYEWWLVTLPTWRNFSRKTER